MHAWATMNFKSAATRPAPVSLIEAFERRIGASLPDDYRAFLLEVNGGRPQSPVDTAARYPIVRIDWEGRPPQESDDVAVVHFLLVAENWKGIFSDGRSDALSLDGCYTTFVEEDRRIPEGLIPIGRDPGGSLFLLDVTGGQRGGVWFWARNWLDRDRLATDPFHNTARIAPTFSGFIERIEFE